MAITFLQTKNRQRNLLLLLALVTFAILIILWQGFFQEEETVPYDSPQALAPSKIQINWSTLRSPELEELQLFEAISPFDGEVGRENPFIPY